MKKIQITTRSLFYAMIISGIIYVISQAAILMTFAPIGGDSVLKFQLTFDTERMAAILNAWGDAGIETFKKHFYFDFLHPLWYSAFLFFSLMFLKSKLSRYENRDTVPKYVFLPFVAAFFDCMENFMEIEIIKQRFNLNETLVMMTGIVSVTKWALSGISILIIAVLAVQLALHARKARIQ